MKLLVYLCSYLGYALLWVASFLPLSMMYLITDVLFIILYYGIHYRRKVVDMNLKNAFPEKSEEERKRIARKYYRHLCDTFAEFYKLWHISEKEIKKRCVMVNMDVPHHYFEQGRSVIAFSGHYGIWEMMYSYKLWEPGIELIPIYKPIHNKVFDRMTCRIRSRFGATPLAKADTLRVMIRNQQEGKIAMTGFIGDQTPNRHSLNFWTEFLNQDTPVMEGTEKIARKLNQAVVFVNLRKVKRGYYHAEFYDLSSNPRELEPGELTRMHTRMLEHFIRENPEYWLWSHRRWKHKRPVG